MERQALNVFRMRLLGAEVRAVNAGTCTLKDATSEAIRDWVSNVETTHYILGSTAGPHPYPMMVSTAGWEHDQEPAWMMASRAHCGRVQLPCWTEPLICCRLV